MWVEQVEVYDLRNIEETRLELGPGLNILVGRNAQGKTSLLEAVGLLSRARSFRSDDTAQAIRRGASALRARARVRKSDRATGLAVEVTPGQRRLEVDGREVSPRAYQGHLEVAVYSTDRLRVVRGPMRERRLFLDRSGAALWPSYGQTVRDFDRVLRQRNAALESGGRDAAAWDERFVALGGRLRQRRAEYAARLRAALCGGYAPADEHYHIALGTAAPEAGEAGQREALAREVEARWREERQARRSLVGPHRDGVRLTVDGAEAATASSGQARSLVLALTLATLEVYREERGEAAVALLDDLDSELDEERTAALCREVSARGQALVTSAHAAWTRAIGEEARVLEVEGGRVRPLARAAAVPSLGAR